MVVVSNFLAYSNLSLIFRDFGFDVNAVLLRRNRNKIRNQHQTAKKYFHRLNSIKYNDVFLNEIRFISCFLLVFDFNNEFF